MKYPVRLFEIPRDASPGDKPKELSGFDVRASTIDGAKQAAVDRLREEGRGIRAISFLADGGLAAIAYPVEHDRDETVIAESTLLERGLPGRRS